MDTNRTCNRCGNAVILELNKDIDYLYYCPACDENMYTFETKELEASMNQARINELRTELEHECISYAELAEIQIAFENLELDQDAREEMLESVQARDMLDELEAYAKTQGFNKVTETEA